MHDPGCRARKLKLIPAVAEGPWMVRKAVGSKPVILGTKLDTHHFSEGRYHEIDIDISANVSAAHATGMVAGALKSLVFDIGIILEGQAKDELPERLLGTVRLRKVDLAAAIPLDTAVELSPNGSGGEASGGSDAGGQGDDGAAPGAA